MIESVDEEQEMSLTDLVKVDVIAALREQASEARHAMGTPDFNQHDLHQNSMWFDTVADWLADHWSEIVEMR